MTPANGKKGNGLVKAAVGVAIIGLASKLLGFLREVVLAKYFGASAATDAYLVALVIPGVLVAALISAITVTFIPIFAESREKHGEKEAMGLVNSTMNLLLLVSAILGGAGMFFAPRIVAMLAPGFNGAQAALAVDLTRIMFPAVLAMAMNGLATAVLQSKGSFWIPAAIGFPYNLIMIAGIVLSTHFGGIAGVAVATALAIFSQAVFQALALHRAGYRYRPVLDLKEEGLRKMGLLIWPVLIGTAAGQINTVVDRWLASTLREGSISALNYGYKLVTLPMGLIVSAVTSVTFPLFAQIAAAGRREELGKVYLETAKILILFFVPLTVGMIILREPFVRAAFQRGAFDAGSTGATAVALMYYSLGLTFFALNDLSSRAFYAVQDTRTPVLVSVMTVILNVVLNLSLIKPMAHGGLALATAIASALGTLAFLALLRRKHGFRGFGRLVMVTGVALTASVVMGAVVWGFYGLIPVAWKTGGFIRQVAALLAAAGLGAGLYLALIKASRLPEGDRLFEMIGKIFRRTKPAERLPQEGDLL